MASELPKRPDRPRNVPGELPKSVTIENAESGNVLSLLVPNRRLFKWYQDHTISASFYLLLLNAAVFNQVVQVDVGSDELAQKVCQRAGSVYRYTRKKSGRARMEFLKQKSTISISHTDILKVTHLQEEIMELKEYVTELQCDMTHAMEELVLCQEAVESMSTQLKEVLMEWDKLVNTGPVYECVGTRQQKRKLAKFKSAADAALWCSESFGLVSKQLMVCTSISNEIIDIPLGESPEPPTDWSVQPATEADELCATLYLLDRFGVSDEFYHELTQVSHCHILNDIENLCMQHTGIPKFAEKLYG